MTQDLEPRKDDAVATLDEDAAQNLILGGLSTELKVPMLKVAQSTTDEVKADQQKQGTFFNAITGDAYDEVELVVIATYQGRLYSPKGAGTFVARNTDVVPSSWPDQFAGKHFADLPEAEEVWKARANDPEDSFEFGSGPPIQTTHNYVGFVIDDPGIPVVLSLKSTATKAAQKIDTLLRFSKPAHGVTIKLTLDRNENNDGSWFTPNATRGRQTTAEERAIALQLAAEYASAQRVAVVGDEDGESPARARQAKATRSGSAEGALDV